MKLSTPTLDDIMEMTPVLDADLVAQIDAAVESAEGMQRVRDGVHDLFVIARDGSMRDIYRAMQKAFVPLPSRRKR
jgi:hypothetical protein